MAEVPNILQRSYQACPAKPQLLLQIFPQSVMVGELPKVPIMIHPKPWNTTPIFGSFSFRSFSIIKSARTKNCSTCLNMWLPNVGSSPLCSANKTRLGHWMSLLLPLCVCIVSSAVAPSGYFTRGTWDPPTHIMVLSFDLLYSCLCWVCSPTWTLPS